MNINATATLECRKCKTCLQTGIEINDSSFSLLKEYTVGAFKEVEGLALGEITLVHHCNEEEYGVVDLMGFELIKSLEDTP